MQKYGFVKPINLKRVAMKGARFGPKLHQRLTVMKKSNFMSLKGAFVKIRGAQSKIFGKDQGRGES